jgi:uptake hydrogenase large subunit
LNRIVVNIDLNRVEGDLEFQIELQDNVIVDCRCIGTLYRGFEQLLVGRAPRDATVITPRVCGICGSAHLYSSVLALEQIWQITPPPNAIRIRNLCLMAETVQSDLRQSFLFFTPDFCHGKYSQHPDYSELVGMFEAFKGRMHLETLEHSRHIVEIVAIMGGQWPHSSYMLPGGVTTHLNIRRVIDAQAVLDKLLQWFEKSVIGCDLDSWLTLASADDLWRWLDHSNEHRQSAIGLITRISRSVGLHKLGAGTAHMLSYGAFCDPDGWSGQTDDRHLLRSGFYCGDTNQVHPFDQAQVTEHVRYSWFKNYEGGLHPYQGETVPDYLPGGDRYTWAKAPRYQDKVVQTGPLAELLIDGEPLIRSLVDLEGGSTWLRQFARIRRCALLLHQMQQTLRELQKDLAGPVFQPTAKQQEVDGEGYGLVSAARGGLGHWVKIRDGVIDHYQIITPTAWNASPKDSAGRHGHWESSMLGLTVEDPDDPVEIGHIVRSHDPCLVCTVHVLGTDKRLKINV